MNHKERSSLLESAKPIVIGEDVWIGGSVVVCPGITIGNRAVIGAGSVVTKDVPQDVFAAGNPCKIIRTLEQ
jgi:maltose O-acetyltransferase